jgi:hypothetical protein
VIRTQYVGVSQHIWTRPLGEIDAELKELEAEIAGRLKEMVR